MGQSAKFIGPNSAPLGSLGNEQNHEPGGGCRRLLVLRSGLEAANVLLDIMSCPGVDRRAVEDDSVEACVNLVRSHVSRHVIPALSNTGHLGAVATGGGGGGDANDAVAVADASSSSSATPPRAKKARTASPHRGSSVAKSLCKLVYAPILSTVGTFGTTLERAEAYVRANEMDDGLLFALTSAALSSLTIDPSTAVRPDAASLASVVQVPSMDLIAAVFGRYPRHRSIIVEDLFPLMLKLPTSKRSMRTYAVKGAGGGGGGVAVKRENAGGDRDYIQPICALTLLLIQSCVVMPSQSDVDMIEEADVDADEEGADGSEGEEEKLAAKADDASGLDGCVSVCNQFTSQMVARCSRKGEEGGASEFRPILANLIDDLLLVRYLVEFPAAEMLLRTISHRVSAIFFFFSAK